MKIQRISIFSVLSLCTLAFVSARAQIPMEQVLSRVTIKSDDGLRGLVDTVGFAHTAEQMDFIGPLCERLEKDRIRENQRQFGLNEETALMFGICPHDDYTLAARAYVHVQRYIKAKTVILIGNAHWSETFGIRNKLIFGDFREWRGPYGPVPVSSWRDEITENLPEDDFTINRTLVETEHSLEALIPFLQYYDRNVEIIPILIPLTEWNTMNRLAEDLTDAVSSLLQRHHAELGSDVAVLCSTDGMHYGDYGWSYYDYHPFGCDASGYEKAMRFDAKLVSDNLVGEATTERIHHLYSSLIDENDISTYKVTWCGRFSVTFASSFATRLARKMENRTLAGYFLRHGSSLQDPWIDLTKYHLGITGDVNLHHFVTYTAMGFK
jgi:AmmeMemoRadiSam system protein B